MQKKKPSFFNLETVIVLLIAGCIIFLNAFTTNKLVELEASGDAAMFIRQDLPYMDSEVLAEEIIQYHPDSCKLIEMYDENFEMVFSLQFSEPTTVQNNIKDFPELMDLFKNGTEGQTEVMLGDTKESVYFQWTNNSRQERRLIVIYTTRPVVKYLWVFTLTCYIVLVLVFVLLIRLHIIRYRDKIKEYKRSSMHVQDKIE